MELKQNRKVRVEVNRENCEDILKSRLDFSFEQIRLKAIEINANLLEEIQPKIRKCNRLEFENCFFTCHIDEFIAKCEDLEMLQLDYHPEMTIKNHLFQVEHANLRILYIQSVFNEHVREVALLIFANILLLPNLQVLSIHMNVYIWFAKYVTVTECVVVRCIHLKWHTTDVDDNAVITALSTSCTQSIFLEISEEVNKNKIAIIKMFNFPFKVYE